jgi:segregation and condensation protein B
MAQLPREFELAKLEALLFAAGDPLSVAQLAELTGLNKPQTWELVTALQEQYEADGRGIMIREVAGGFQMCTKPAFDRVVEQLATTQELKLSNAALETLAIIAFRQPMTRAEIEAIRGVNVDGVVNTLLDWQLITEAGRKQTVGHPILYKTTDRFLTVFGLRSLEDLPALPELVQEEMDRHPQQLSLLDAGEQAAPSADEKEPDQAEKPEDAADAGEPQA